MTSLRRPRTLMACAAPAQRALWRLLAPLALLLVPLSAHASVTATFWSHEFGNDFPHAFITLRGVPDAGGPPVDRNIGFTPKLISPAMLFGKVAGKYDIAKPHYIASSDAQFSVVLSDAQYADVLKLIDEWGENGDHRYDLNTRNCVTFVREAARRAGLLQVEFPKLMKKPRSFLKAVAAANPTQVTLIGQSGKAYFATLPPLEGNPVMATPAGTQMVNAAAAVATEPGPVR